jgi:hypothetical protein
MAKRLLRMQLLLTFEARNDRDFLSRSTLSNVKALSRNCKINLAFTLVAETIAFGN